MIGRIWHGWTTEANADEYERLLREEIFPHIASLDIEGYRGIQLLRRRLQSGDFEFITIMRFDSLNALREFAGEDFERAHVPPKAREVLARFDERSQHYEIRHQIDY